MAAVGQRGGVIEQTLTLSAPRPGLGQSGRARMPEFHGRFEEKSRARILVRESSCGERSIWEQVNVLSVDSLLIKAQFKREKGGFH